MAKSKKNNKQRKSNKKFSEREEYDSSKRAKIKNSARKLVDRVITVPIQNGNKLIILSKY